LKLIYLALVFRIWLCSRCEDRDGRCVAVQVLPEIKPTTLDAHEPASLKHIIRAFAVNLFAGE
jgi:hypothetical protein